ncbi:MAG: hypothetical protein KDA93_06560 [Planctomycetaceae bacterium]|nr:hypothetical protein [Planctomycetaceae bacterium]
MPNNLGFRSGQVVLQKFRVESTSIVEPGDMVYLDETHIRPASELTWNTDLATTQADFANVFVGIAHESSTDGEDAPVSIDVSSSSVYEFDVANATYDNGNPLGADGSGSVLLSQQLAYADPATQAIARAAEFVNQMTTRLRVTFASAYSTGSANSNASIG